MNSAEASMDAAAQSDKPTQSARLGAITRELHEALRALGTAPQLQQVLSEMPDTRSRLAHVGDMTEQAAHKVLGLVEDALPRLDAHGRLAEASVLESGDARATGFAQQSIEFVADQRRTLTEIMVAQDFQDLSGQVIKRVIDVILRTEAQLLQLLVDAAEGSPPSLTSGAAQASELQGPQTPDKALQQDDVDDLLASLGF